MYNKKTLAVIGITALMFATMAGCGSKNNSAAEVNTTTATTAASNAPWCGCERRRWSMAKDDLIDDLAKYVLPI